MTQHLEALALANEIRTGGARFRREVGKLDQRGGMRRLANELDGEIPADVGALQLEAFLCAAHRMGHQRAARFLRAAGLWRKPNTRLRDLTRRERDALAGTLRAYEPDPRSHQRAA